MFPRAVLRAPPRGGKRRRVHFSRLLSERLRRWLSGDYEALWSEATCASKAPKRTLEEQADSLEKRCERAKALTQEGNLSKACSALLSYGIADVIPSVLCDLRSKHPSRPTAVKLPVTSLPPSIQMTRDEVVVGIRSFPAASGAGTSKLSPDHLREALKCATPLKSERLLDEITSLVNILASGEVCPSLATRICAAYLHPLLKKDGGIRPVAVGETFRRLVSKCLNSAIRKEAASILSPLQLGVGVRGGCEIAIHSLRSVVDKLGSDDRTCLMKIDFKNAFNVISRQTVLNQVHSLFPGILRWSSFCLLQETPLIVSRESLLSSSGVQQGDPLSPLLFSLALKHLTDILVAKGPKLSLLLFYLDDGMFVGSIEAVREAFDLINVESTNIGLELNTSKCELWWPTRSEEWNTFPPAVQRINSDGIEFLGAGIGSPRFVNELNASRAEKAANLQSLITEMDDPQCELLLLRSCAGVCKVTHALRTSPPNAIGDSISTFDESLRRSLEKICQASINDSAWSQASLPIRDGGFGLMTAASSAAPAFVASCKEAYPFVKQLLEDPETTVPGMEESIDSLRVLGGASVDSLLETEPAPGLQHRLSAAISTRLRRNLFDAACPRDKARLNSLASTHAGAWLQALPMPTLGLAFPPREFRVILRHSLGLQLYSAPRSCPACNNSQLDVWGIHSVSCSSGGDRIGRHNAVRDALFHVAQAAAFSPTLETGHNLPDSQRRPGDITIPNWSRGRPAAVDVTVTSPLQISTIANAAREAGVAARRREVAKDTSNLGDCEAAGIEFLPVSVETFGAWGPVALETINAISYRWADHHGESRSRAVNWIYQKLSVAVQRGNATMLLARNTVVDLP